MPSARTRTSSNSPWSTADPAKSWTLSGALPAQCLICTLRRLGDELVKFCTAKTDAVQDRPCEEDLRRNHVVGGARVEETTLAKGRTNQGLRKDGIHHRPVGVAPTNLGYEFSNSQRRGSRSELTLDRQ